MENYKILGLTPNCTLDDIKKSYHRLAHKHHPDKGGDVREFIKVKNAYEFLMNNHGRVQQNQQQNRPVGRTTTVYNQDGTTTVYYTVYNF